MLKDEVYTVRFYEICIRLEYGIGKTHFVKKT